MTPNISRHLYGNMHNEERGYYIMKKKISIVMPCYCSSLTIGYVLDKIEETMAKHEEYDYEVILVNDGSADNTFEVLTQYAQRDPHIIAVDFSKNFGQHSALMAGYSLVTGDYVLGMDDDGEHNPEHMFQLIDKLEEGYDYVCARFTSNDHSLYKRLGSKFNDWMATNFIGKPKDAIFSSYYVMRRYVVNEIVKSRNPHPYVGGMLVSVTKKLTSVPIEHCARKAGSSGYSLKNSIALWVNGITAYSVIPLRFASMAGCISAGIGFLIGFYQVIRKLLDPDVLAGYTSLIACILWVGGIIMLLLGMIGEYIGRIYMLNNQIPQYVIKTVYRKEVQEENAVEDTRVKTGV